jgi:DNA polymerase-3 subunit alpha
MKPEFIHLHTHSHYSLLDGMSKIRDLVAKAKSFGMTSLALTDHGVMYGAIEFYKACKSADIKPIIGVEAYIAERTRFDKESNIDNKRYHLTLLAKNYTGYKNLMKLVSASYVDGYYYKPRMDEELLRNFSEGIICLSGCPAGELAHAIRANDEGKQKEIIKKYQDIFGKENFFLELMGHVEVEHYDVLKEGVKKLSKELDIPIVATWDSHYLHESDKDAHNTLLAINTQGNSMKMTGDYSFIDPTQALEYFKDTPDAISNTIKVAEMVNIELDLGKWVFPNFELDSGETADSQVKRNIYAGIEKRYGKSSPEIEKRIEYELGIIKQKGFSIYFLIVADLIDFARSNGILTNIRGSVAGSICSYLLGITTVDPFRFELPFERFLNPERPSAPDIDMDFADDRRDEVIEYAKRKYGESSVAQIGTFGTMMARGSVRDVARALGYPYDVGDKISKLIPLGKQGFPMTINIALDMVEELKTLYEKDKATKEIIDMAKKIEGCARHISVHAAGVVISPTRVDDYTPIQLDPKGGKIITQYDMHAVESAGLIKLDFLGIRNLAILGDAVKLVKKIEGVNVDIENIPMDDKKTFEMLAKGETMGTFQLNGSGMTRYLKELRPSVIDDINAMVALYRPGPMEMIPEYIRRKHNHHLIRFLDPRMKDILNLSYGVITYQDDVMMIAIKLAGYSWLEADKLRKAMGKKIPEVMAAEKDKLIKGLLENGMEKSKTETLWSLIEPFAAYGFNKAHAASYGRVAYQTAYMKANFPVPYMTAILTAESGDVEKVSEIIHECARMNIQVLPPDVNECFGGFTVIKNPNPQKMDSIRFGFYTIKNLGKDIADAIIEERKVRGKFSSIEDFLERVTHKNVNKKSLEALIKSGAMDAFGERGILVANIENLTEFNKSFSKRNLDQNSLFGGDLAPKSQLKLNSSEEATAKTKLAWEKELLGLYVSGHPLDNIREKIEKSGTNISKIKLSGRQDQPMTLACVVQTVKIIITKKNQQMAFIQLEDLSGTIEAVAFPTTYKKYINMFLEDKILAIKCKVSIRDGEKTLIIDEVKEI